jgi:hypothetical protein
LRVSIEEVADKTDASSGDIDFDLVYRGKRALAAALQVADGIC